MVDSHSVSHDCRCSEYYLYHSIVGNQDAFPGYSSPPICYDRLILLIMQTQSWDEVPYRHTLDAALTIWRTEGPSAFYRGLLPSLLGILHVAVQFPLYEQLKIMAREFLSRPPQTQSYLHFL